MHNVTDVWHGRRMVRIRRGMLMVGIRRRLGMEYAGRNTERGQQQEHTIGCTQAQGA